MTIHIPMWLVWLGVGVAAFLVLGPVATVMWIMSGGGRAADAAMAAQRTREREWATGAVANRMKQSSEALGPASAASARE